MIRILTSYIFIARLTKSEETKLIGGRLVRPLPPLEEKSGAWEAWAILVDGAPATVATSEDQVRAAYRTLTNVSDVRAWVRRGRCCRKSGDY